MSFIIQLFCHHDYHGLQAGVYVYRKGARETGCSAYGKVFICSKCGKEVFVRVHRYYTVTYKPTGETLTKDGKVIVFSYEAAEWFMGASFADGKRRKRSEFRPAPIEGDLPENSISAEQWVGCEPSKIPWDQQGGE